MCKGSGQKFLLVYGAIGSKISDKNALVVTLGNDEEVNRIIGIFTRNDENECSIFRVGVDDIPEEYIDIAIESGFEKIIKTSF